MGMPAATEAPEALVLREDNGRIATLTLNRPRQYNALSEELLAALQQELDALAQDDTIRVVVLSANGKAFCAGHDLKQMRSKPSQEYYESLFAQCSRMMLSIHKLPQPVIARVQGIATAAGCQLVAACDLALAAEEARFATSGVNLGLFCSTPAVPVSRNLSRKNAARMLLTGDFIDAETAAAQGLINEVVPAEQLDGAVWKLAQTIAAKPPAALRIGKEMFYRQLQMPLEDAYSYAGERMACNLMDPDAAEGVDAFIEKRHPNWS